MDKGNGGKPCRIAYFKGFVKYEENMPKLTKDDNEINHRYEFTEDDLQIVEHFASLGLSIPDIAAALAVGEKYLYQVLREEQKEAESFKGRGKFLTAFLDTNIWGRHERGLRRHKTIITKGLMEHAVKGNPQVLMFLAKSKLGWHDRPILEEQNALDSEIISEIQIGFIEPEKLSE